MVLSFVSLAFVSLLKLLLRGGRRADAKDIELLGLRHQLEILRRQGERPKLRPSDRALLAAAGRLLPPARRRGLLVAPQTLLRWHRELVRRRWTYPRATPGRPQARPDIELAAQRSPQLGDWFGPYAGPLGLRAGLRRRPWRVTAHSRRIT